MRFRVERDEFTDAVAWTARTLPSRATTHMQVLAGLLLDATGDALRVAAFDYEVAAQCEVDATVSEEGRALVNGKMLADIARSLPAAPVDLEIDGSRLAVRCGTARFALPMLPVDDYPTLPSMPTTVGTIEGPVFAAAVAQVAVAAGRDDTLPVLTGIKVEIDGKRMTLAATDRYRLAARDVDWSPVDGQVETAALIPAKTMQDVAKTLAGSGTVTVALGNGPSGETLAGFACGRKQTTTRLLDGKFPPYRKLLPDTSPLIAQVDIPPLSAAAKRVALVAPKTAPVQLTFRGPDTSGELNGTLTLEAGQGSEAQASETLPVVYDGPELTVAYNPAYLLDALNAVEGDVARFGWVSAEDMQVSAAKPSLLTGPDGDLADYRYLLMPIRLNG